MSKQTRKVEQLEESILEALLNDINECNDVVDMFKGLERYKLFNEGRQARANADYETACISEVIRPEGGYQ